MSEKDKNIVAMGLDVGTMNIVCARSDLDEIKSIRNVFLPVSNDISLNDLSDVSYVKDSEDNVFIIGNSAFTMANIFGKEVCRPMEKGLISPKEIASSEVLALMLQNLIGSVENKNVYCTYSVPAQAIDEGRSVLYHEQVFSRILNTLGVNNTPANEAMAIIYSETQNENFSGVAVSFGAGMSNIAISYHGVEAYSFSTARGGDWIDNNVSASLGIVPNRVTNIKEKYLDLSQDFQKEKNRKRRRVLEALHYYYSSLIEYTIENIATQFDKHVDLDIDEEIPIVVSGGTSLPNGFVDLFKNLILEKDLPFDVSEIRSAKNPFTAVASGLLVKTLADTKE